VDAIPPATLRELVRGCIERHLDPSRLRTTAVAEESERLLLTAIAGHDRGSLREGAP
jgi:hypothetical protein